MLQVKSNVLVPELHSSLYEVNFGSVVIGSQKSIMAVLENKIVIPAEW